MTIAYAFGACSAVDESFEIVATASCRTSAIHAPARTATRRAISETTVAGSRSTNREAHHRRLALGGGGMRRYFRVRIPRRKVVTYERVVTAESAEHAIQIVNDNTPPWPSSYDEITHEVVDGDPSAEDITTDELVECWGDPDDPDNSWRGDP